MKTSYCSLSSCKSRINFGWQKHTVGNACS